MARMNKTLTPIAKKMNKTLTPITNNTKNNGYRTKNITGQGKSAIRRGSGLGIGRVGR